MQTNHIQVKFASMRDSFDLSAYLVIGPENTKGRAVRDVARDALAGGITFIQLRSKTADAREMLIHAKYIAQEIAEAGKSEQVAFVINDRVDIALAARLQGFKVDGVHLGQSDVPPELARQMLGDDAVIGLSADIQDVNALAETVPDGVLDYLGTGPVHETATKPDCGLVDGVVQVQGVQGVDAVANAASLPVVAGGGVKLADIPTLAKSAVAGFFVVTAISESDDPELATEELVTAWNKNRGICGFLPTQE